MKSISKILISSIAVLLVISLIIISCKKDEKAVAPTVATGSVTSKTTISAVCDGDVTNEGGAAVTARGVCWSTVDNPTVSDAKTISGSGAGNFTCNMTGLLPGTSYYIRAYATNSVGTSYGSSVSFTTVQTTVPVLTTTAITGISQTTAVGGGNVSLDGGEAVTSRGICWSTGTSPTINDFKTIDGSGNGSFTSALTGMVPLTAYNVRAYATNSVGTGYGNVVSFTTLSVVVPVVTVNSFSSIKQTSAVSGGNVTNDGGASVIARGVCWSTNTNPSLNDSKTTDGSGSGAFTSSITGLQPNTTYYVKAYATNNVGTGYSDASSFKTAPIDVPTVTTSPVTSILQTTAVGGGAITNNGGSEVTAKGICWSTSPNPTLSNAHTSDGTGSASFTSNMTGLTAFTVHYVRAYATNIAGTAYGDLVTFKTLSYCVNFTKTYTAGSVAPVTKTVTYNTTVSTLSGAEKCWITQNLGADHEATIYSDATEASAGWYWQFNQRQGYKHTGTVRTPNTTWITSINESTDWLSANDPCKLLLGVDWRLPSTSEWTNAKNTGNWFQSPTAPFYTELKLHFAGWLDPSSGDLKYRNSQGIYYSSSQYSDYVGCYIAMMANYYVEVCGGYSGGSNKSMATPLRCMRNVY